LPDVYINREMPDLESENVTAHLSPLRVRTNKKPLVTGASFN